MLPTDLPRSFLLDAEFGNSFQNLLEFVLETAKLTPAVIRITLAG